MATLAGFIVPVSFVGGGVNGLRPTGDAAVPHTLPVPNNFAGLADKLHNGPIAGPRLAGSPATHTPVLGVGFLTKTMGEFWFDRLHVIPKKLVFGNILGTVNKAVYLYNAFLIGSHTLNSFVNNAGVGLAATSLPGLPVTIPAQNGLSINIQVTTAGVPAFDTTLDFVMDLYTLSLPVSGSRVIMLPFRPETPFIETIEFKTDVMEHKDGTEQRVSGRLHPRLIYTFDVVREYGDEFGRFDFLLYEWQQRVFGMPMWHEPMFVTAPVTAGDTVINVNSTANCSIKSGGLVMLYTSETSFTALSVLSTTGTTITASSPVDFSYVAGTEVYPVRPALANNKIQGVRERVGMGKWRMVMRATDNVDDIASTLGFSSYLGKVLLDDANFTDSQMGESIERRLYEIDGGTGIFSQSSLWPRPRRSSVKGFVCHDRANLWATRQLLYALRGKQVSFYIPTFHTEMTPSRALSSGTPQLFINNVGYTRFQQARAGRNIVRITLKNGTQLLRNITASAILSTTEEILTVDANWVSTIAADQVAVIDFYEKARFDTDSFTLTHENSLGACRISAPVRSVLE